jgi:imidazolonepropionase-like amidohydrolase
MRTVLVTGSLMLVMLAGCSEQPQSGAAADRIEKALPEVVALVGGTLVDGTDAGPLTDSVVVIQDGRIECAGASGGCSVPDSARVIDVTGRWLTPGLIDAHVHFSQTAWGDGRPDALDVRSLYPFEAVQARQRARPDRYFRAYLCAGVTAVFDVGGFPWTWGLRERVAGDPFAPHVAAAGPLVSHVNPPQLALPAEQQFIDLADSEVGRSAVRYLAANRSDAVKVWFIRPSEEMRVELDARLTAVGDEARTYGLPLIVHATELREAKVAVRAGASLLVHSVEDQEVDDEFIALLTDPDRRVIYTPTLIVHGGYLRMYESALSGEPPPEVDDPNRCVDQDTLRKIEESSDSAQFVRFDRERFEKYRDRTMNDYRIMETNLVKLYEAGAMIAMGTDAGNPLTVAGPSVYAEMEAMQAAGMPPSAVVTAATRNSAMAMGMDGEIGTVEAGKIADLLVLAGDPTADVSNFRKLEAVIRGGRFHAQQGLQRPERAGS